MDVTLVMFRENGERRDFPLSGENTVIGRAEDCTMRIPLPDVSRRHVTLEHSGDRVVAKDMGSANGTFVNNRRVTEQELSAGDHLVIGPVVFTVQIGGEPDEIRPVKTRLRRAQAAPADARSPTRKVDEELDEDDLFGLDAEIEESDADDPISALEALASSADQTAIDPFEEEEDDEEKR